MSTNQKKLVSLYNAKNSYAQALVNKAKGIKNCVTCGVERISFK